MENLPKPLAGFLPTRPSLIDAGRQDTEEGKALRPRLQLVTPRFTNASNAFDEVNLYIDAFTNVINKSSQQWVLHSFEAKHGGGHNTGGDNSSVNVRATGSEAIHLLRSNLDPLETIQMDHLNVEGEDWAIRVRDSDHDGIQEMISLAKDVRIFKYNLRNSATNRTSESP